MDKEKMAKDNIGLVHQVINDYYKYLHLTLNLDKEDVFMVGCRGLSRAINKYNKEIAEFSTFAYYCIHHEIGKEVTLINYKKRNPKDIDMSSLDTVINEDGDTLNVFVANEDNLFYSKNIDIHAHDLSEFVDSMELSLKEEVVVEVLKGNMTYKEAGELFNLTAQRMKQISVKLVEKIRKELEKCV